MQCKHSCIVPCQYMLRKLESKLQGYVHILLVICIIKAPNNCPIVFNGNMWHCTHVQKIEVTSWHVKCMFYVCNLSIATIGFTKCTANTYVFWCVNTSKKCIKEKLGKKYTWKAHLIFPWNTHAFFTILFTPCEQLWSITNKLEVLT